MESPPVVVEHLEARLFLARAETVISADWAFNKGDVAGASAVSYNDAGWSKLSLPHTWNNLDAQDGGNNYFRGVGWYRKRLKIDASAAGKRIFLKFDAASLVADVYVNGSHVGQHRGGFAAFTYDITSRVAPNSDAVIAIKVNNASQSDIAPRSGDFPIFGGIYRDVHLIVTDPVHINLLNHGSPGVFIKQSNVSSTSANLEIVTEVRNDASVSRNVTISATVFDQNNFVYTNFLSTATIAANTTTNISQGAVVWYPRLWNGLKDPHLYRVRVAVSDSNGSFDEIDQPLGFRSIKIDPNQGLMLNGQKYDLFGANLHQDRLNKGWAISGANRDQDIDFLVELGATGARLAHYQHDDYTYTRLDREGLLAWAEIPLIEVITDSVAFTNNARQQLRELIRQNYNHPSIAVWGIFNELDDVPAAGTLAANLAALVKSEDPTRLSATATDASDTSSLNFHTDVTAFNKYFGWYYGKASDIGAWADSIHAKYPSKAIGLSEYGAGGSIYQHQVPPSQPSAGGKFHPEEYQSQYHETHWKALKSRPFIWSKFVWNLFDFASDYRNEGDTPGRNDKGLVTYDRQTRKDAFYFYKANWSKSPVLHITSRRYTNRTSASTEVKVYSNLPNPTLYVNGKSLGTTTGSDGIYRWNITLAAGANNVLVTSNANGANYSDTVTWNLAANEPPPTTSQRPYHGSPFHVGSSGVTIQAEDFDIGGQGVSYWDIESANLGGKYRTGDRVDVDTASDTGGGFYVGYVKSGEWLEYTINVATSSTYSFDFRLASPGSNGKFHVKVDGENVTGSLVVPNTGSWQKWTTLSKAGVFLTQGQHVVRLSMDTAGSTGSIGNFNHFTIRPATATPPPPSMSTLTIQAEDFDAGAQGVAYNDVDPGNQGGAYRNTGVDIQTTMDSGGGYNLSHVKAGEWLNYTINITTAGTYTFDFRVASAGSNGKFHLDINGVDRTGQLTVPSTGSWQSWTTVSKSGITLAAGTHVLRLRMDANGSTGSVGNFNWIRLTRT